ncbi:hypothetical protein IFM89_006566 [Coptis chinensis]|uniref:Uncharacterized protein n=1 Tax=Coptis chinensis TaxID=261450 RepID=A0A835ILG5_9MAGN|nr:hypothetical protein IFM89_006566 [Coptis chinensis]
MFALIAVHKHKAASRSASPWMRVQQGLFAGVPTSTPINPPSKLAQTPSFSASLGHVPAVGVGGVLGVGVGVEGVGVGVGGVLGIGVGVEGVGVGLGVGGVLGIGVGVEGVGVGLGVGGVLGVGVCFGGHGGGFGLGGGLVQGQLVAVTREKKRRLSARKRATAAWLLEPISY